MAVKVDYKASVANDLRKLGRTAALRVKRKIEKELTAGSPRETPLSGVFAGMFRLRVGAYRVIYVPTAPGYLVLRIGHRREVYRKGPPEV